MILTDNDFEAILTERKPVLLLFYADDLRGEFDAAFKRAAAEHADILFARIALGDNPKAAGHFSVGKKSTMIALYQGQTLIKRNRPWGADVPLAVEMLRKAQAEDRPPSTVQPSDMPKEQKQMDIQPVNVTDDNFQQEVIDHELPVLVDFWAEWCGPCRMVAPILDKLAGEFAGKVRIAKVNVDENPGLAQYFQVMSIPTMMMFKQQTIVFNQAGALPEPSLRDLLNQLITLEIPPREEAEGQPKD